MVYDMLGILAKEVQIFRKQNKWVLRFRLFCPLASVLTQEKYKNGKSRNQGFWEGIYVGVRTASKTFKKIKI